MDFNLDDLLAQPEYEKNAEIFQGFLNELNLNNYLMENELTCFIGVPSEVRFKRVNIGSGSELDYAINKIIAQSDERDIESASSSRFIFSIRLGNLYQSEENIRLTYEGANYGEETIKLALEDHRKRQEYLTEEKLQEIKQNILQALNMDEVQNKLSELNGVMEYDESHSNNSSLLRVEFVFS